MKERFGNVHSRRELFTAACRYGALGLLTAGAGGIFAKRRRLVSEGKCIGSGACTGCVILARCGLPAAVSAKESVIGGDNVGE